MRLRRRLALGCGLLAVLTSGCATMERTDSSSTSREPSAEFLRPVSDWPGDLVLQQRVTIRWQGGEESFGAVLQKRGDELLLLGLGPMNSVGFTLALDESGVRLESRIGRDLPFEPERILADVQRVFYPWVDGDVGCADCESRSTCAGLNVSEKRGKAFLEERRFEDISERQRGLIVVRYDDWIDGGSIPGRAVLSNGWYDYELIVETKSVERLDP